MIVLFLPQGVAATAVNDPSGGYYTECVSQDSAPVKFTVTSVSDTDWADGVESDRLEFAVVNKTELSKYKDEVNDGIAENTIESLGTISERVDERPEYNLKEDSKNYTQETGVSMTVPPGYCAVFDGSQAGEEGVIDRSVGPFEIDWDFEYERNPVTPSSTPDSNSGGNSNSSNP